MYIEREKELMQMIFKRKLPVPRDIKAEYPLGAEHQKIVLEREKEIREIFEGKNDKLLLIIGPCSADHQDSVLDYMNRHQLEVLHSSTQIIIAPGYAYHVVKMMVTK